MKLCFFLTAFLLHFCLNTEAKVQRKSKNKNVQSTAVKTKPKAKTSEPVLTEEKIVEEKIAEAKEQTVPSTDEEKNSKEKVSEDDEEPKTFPKDAYLDLEGRTHVSVFEEKGLNWKNCTLPCQAVAWLENSSQFKVIGKKEIFKDGVDEYGIQGDIEYYPVEVTKVIVDEKGEKKEELKKGWLVAGFVHFKEAGKKPPAPIYDLKPPEKSKEEKCSSSALSKEIGGCNIPEIAHVMNMTAFNESVETLMTKVGQCVDSQKVKTSNGAINYDLFVLPMYVETAKEKSDKNKPKMKKISVPKIIREDKKPMTREDLINIDALARTLYGEVASCFKQGLNYPIAVAQVAMNRDVAVTEAKKRKSNHLNKTQKTRKSAPQQKSAYIKGEHEKAAPQVAQLLTSPSQFNTWMTSHYDKKAKEFIPNPALKNALCPPSERYQFLKKIEDPSIPHEVDVWRNSVQIATEAILYPKKFSKRTSKMDPEARYFTSYMTRPPSYKQILPEIEGRKFKKHDCVQVWSIPKEAKVN